MNAPSFSLPCRLRWLLLLASLAAVALSSGCSPSLDWRLVQGIDAPFTVLLPAKPATLSRPIDLDGMTVTMSMTAAEINGVTFAVGSIVLPDAALAPKALQAIKIALVRNINGSIQREQAGAADSVDIVATGTLGRTRQAARLIAHFAARERRVYQAIVVGADSAVNAIGVDATDIFFTSLKLQ